MASLQARHTRGCALGRPWTTFKDAAEGCTCPKGPLYHVTYRADGKLIREPAGHNRKAAERAWKKIDTDLDAGSHVIPRNVSFEKWVDEWFAGLRRATPNTRRSYKATIAYAKQAFGKKKVRDLRVADVQRFVSLTEKKSAATQLRHLRVLHACLGVAARRGLVARNPVDGLEPSEKPPAPEKLPTYFTDAELARLWPALDNEEKHPPVYANLCRVALTSGVRQGELLGLTWGDVELLERELTIQRSYVQGLGLQARTKGGKTRTVDLASEAVSVLEKWFAKSGSPEADALVFPHPTSGGYLNGSTITRQVLYEAMKDAGIPRAGEHGRKRTFHSFRHSFARVALQNGARMDWVQRQLGHSTITLTVDLYGRWERAAEKAEAKKLEGAFPV
jgi:integrase